MAGTIDVAILVGSEANWEVMKAAAETLRDFGVSYETRVLSAHRTPAETAEYVRKCDAAGTRVFIAAAGMAAHLAGAVAAQTTRPVLGVPLASSELNGLDALLSTVQMPAGIPVGTVGIGKIQFRCIATGYSLNRRIDRHAVIPLAFDHFTPKRGQHLGQQ